MWIRRASRGRLERPSSWRELRGTSGSGFAVVLASGRAVAVVVAGSEGGGVEMWPLASWGEAILGGLTVCAIGCALV